VGPWNQVLDGGRDTTRSGAKVDILSGGRTGANADWGLLDGVHIGATWQIRLNCLCAAVMLPYVKLFDHLLLLLLLWRYGGSIGNTFEEILASFP